MVQGGGLLIGLMIGFLGGLLGGLIFLFSIHRMLMKGRIQGRGVRTSLEMHSS